jgi:hypothetical protein
MAKHKLRLDTERAAVELTLPDGTTEYYQPSAGTAAELYDTLKAAAHEDPTTVLDVLAATAEQVQPEKFSAAVDAPEGSDGEREEGLVGAAGGPNPYDAWNVFGNINNHDTL